MSQHLDNRETWYSNVLGSLLWRRSLVLIYYGIDIDVLGSPLWWRSVQPGRRSLVLIFTRVTTVEVEEECTYNLGAEEPRAVGCSRRLLAEDPQLI